jgi:hypothetical protein
LSRDVLDGVCSTPMPSHLGLNDVIGAQRALRVHEFAAPPRRAGQHDDLREAFRQTGAQ